MNYIFRNCFTRIKISKINRNYMLVNSHKRFPSFHSRLYSSSNDNNARSKWAISKFFVRGRKLNTDDFLAIASWLVIGNGALLVLGTTAFVSIWLGIITRLPFQDDIIQILCNKIMENTGMELYFRKAEWKEGYLRLLDVKIIRDSKLTGEQVSAFDLSVREVDVKLDLLLWLDGKSILTELAIRGAKGIVDRRHLDYTDVDPSVWLNRRTALPNDLYLTKLLIEDCLVSVYDFNNFRPYDILIHRADLKRFRVQWLLFDLLSAENVVGEYDGSLFSLSKIYFDQSDDQHFSTKLRIPNLNIDMVNYGSSGPFGWIKSGTVDIDMLMSFPKQSFDSDLHSLQSDLENVTVKVLEDLKGKISARKQALELKFRIKNNDDSETTESFAINEEPVGLEQVNGQNDNVEFYLDLRFNHVHAVIPENYQGGISDVLVRTIVAYLNSQPTAPRYRKTSTPPLSVQFALPLANFDGSWTVYQSELLDCVSQAVSDELMKQVLSFYKDYSEKGKMRRGDSESPGNNTYGNRNRSNSGLLVKVGWWGLQQLSKGLLSIVDSVKARHHVIEDESLSEVFDEVVKEFEVKKDE